MGEEKVMVLGGRKRHQASTLDGPSQQFPSEYAAWKKRGATVNRALRYPHLFSAQDGAGGWGQP